MRKYLVSGFLVYSGGAVRPLAATAVLNPDECMNPVTVAQVEKILLDENNRTGAVATSMRVTHFQPFETAPPASEVIQEVVQLNECSVIMPPVDSPLLIEVAPGVLLRATRPAHAANRNDPLLFNLEHGGSYLGQPRWTHP